MRQMAKRCSEARSIRVISVLGCSVVLLFCSWLYAQSSALPSLTDPVCQAPTFTVYSYGFEPGWDDWWADNGVWEVGVPTSGPNSVHGGSNCAATILSGNYPFGTDSRLISPPVTLPVVAPGEEMRLRFWNWSSYAAGTNYPYYENWDYGQVQVSTYESGTWTAWNNQGSEVNLRSGTWTLKQVDLTSYAGKIIRIAFYHVQRSGNVAAGWYIDDVSIEKKLPCWTGTFESGWGDWWTENGVWEVGAPAPAPAPGPNSAHGGVNCAATILNGNYPAGTGSRLVSPTITLPIVEPLDAIRLRFWGWWSYAAGTNYPYYENWDYGQVQVSTYESGTWTSWKNEGSEVNLMSGTWSLKQVDLTAYAGKKIRIAFLHVQRSGNVAAGWYIDDIEIIAPPRKLFLPEVLKNSVAPAPPSQP